MSLRPADPIAYEICVQGHLGEEWTDWFGNLTIKAQFAADGSPFTQLTGPIPDQSALTGILLQLSNINMPIISVNPVYNNARNS